MGWSFSAVQPSGWAASASRDAFLSDWKFGSDAQSELNHEFSIMIKRRIDLLNPREGPVPSSGRRRESHVWLAAPFSADRLETWLSRGRLLFPERRIWRHLEGVTPNFFLNAATKRPRFWYPLSAAISMIVVRNSNLAKPGLGAQHRSIPREACACSRSEQDVFA